MPLHVRLHGYIFAETANVDYRLPTKGNKLPFSVCRKQTEVCRFIKL
jgi:hypothetical protein